MATVHRKAYTMKLPAGAEIVERDGVRIARWRLRNGKFRSAEVVDGQDGTVRVRGRSAFYTARFRDAKDQVVEISTGCRDEVAARQVLADLVKRSERARAGLLTEAEDAVIDHRRTSIDAHVKTYMSHLAKKHVNGRRVSPPPLLQLRTQSEADGHRVQVWPTNEHRPPGGRTLARAAGIRGYVRTHSQRASGGAGGLLQLVRPDAPHARQPAQSHVKGERKGRSTSPASGDDRAGADQTA